MTPPYECLVVSKFPDTCEFTVEASLGPASIQATFNRVPPPPPPCTVPRVAGKTLARAKARLGETHCAVGKVRYAVSLKAQKGRVIFQNPKAHWQLVNGAVDLVVGMGRRQGRVAGRSRHG